MKPYLRRFRPRYSLRLALVGFAVLAALIALNRDPLRRRLESLLAFRKNPANRLVIEGPPTAGIPVAIDPPSPDDILQALTRAGVKPPPGLRMVIQRSAVNDGFHAWAKFGKSRV